MSRIEKAIRERRIGLNTMDIGELSETAKNEVVNIEQTDEDLGTMLKKAIENAVREGKISYDPIKIEF